MDNMLQLLCHPKMPANSVKTVSAGLSLIAEEQLWLRYYVEVEEPHLEIGEPGDSIHTDGLWQTTCFEAFLADHGGTSYIELNFAPSSAWAAYEFADIRTDMKKLTLPTKPEIGLEMSAGHVALEAQLNLPKHWRGKQLSVGLTAVMEEPSGIKSYWALKHNKAAPDFHDRSCFTARVEAGV